MNPPTDPVITLLRDAIEAAVLLLNAGETLEAFTVLEDALRETDALPEDEPPPDNWQSERDKLPDCGYCKGSGRALGGYLGDSVIDCPDCGGEGKASPEDIN